MKKGQRLLAFLIFGFANLMLVNFLLHQSQRPVTGHYTKEEITLSRGNNFNLKIKIEESPDSPNVPNPQKGPFSVAGMTNWWGRGVRFFDPDTMPLLTLFTTFKEVEERVPMHRLTVQNWGALRPYVQPVLFSNSTGGTLVELARKHGWDVRPIPAANSVGTPYIKDMYLTAYKHYNSIFYGYSNGDILFTEGLVSTLKAIRNFHVNQSFQLPPPFIVGGRAQYELKSTANESDLWKPNSVSHIFKHLKLKGPKGNALDYFITFRYGYPWSQVLNMVIARAGYDNYLTVMALYYNLTVIGTWRTNPAVHLQGARMAMTHFSDGDKQLDNRYNMNLIRKHGGVPFSVATISSGRYKTRYDQNKTVFVFASENWQPPKNLRYVYNMRQMRLDQKKEEALGKAKEANKSNSS